MKSTNNSDNVPEPEPTAGAERREKRALLSLLFRQPPDRKEGDFPSDDAGG